VNRIYVLFCPNTAYYINYKHNLLKQLSTNLKLIIVIYDQFKFVSDPSLNISEVTR
jgi:hypothetical protein